MPTAARLVAALILAATGFLASEIVKSVIEQEMDFGWLTLINTVLGALCGWIVVGSRAGRGYSAAIGNGLTGGAALVFWALFLQAVNEMVRLSLRRVYDGPMEAIAAVFELLVEYGAYLLDGQVIWTLLAGALLSGLVAEFASRRWR
ncbi:MULTISPECIES: TrgA family protein [unclassified Rhodosalinus]|uniref:TrgA family protein n=1 Tax=unclassified Rhodosalinus TaxID=2630183 RepID=UPI003526A5CC